jgi:hypothetical protein
LFTEMEREQERMRQLEVEWGQLQLEQSTWAAHSAGREGRPRAAAHEAAGGGAGAGGGGGKVKFTNSPLLSQLLPAWRARFVAALILLAFGTLAARSVWLQVVRTTSCSRRASRAMRA